MANYPRYSVKYGVLLSSVVGVSLLAGCGGDGSSGGGSGSTTASFAVTDAPVDDVESIKVTFSRLDLKPAQGDPISVSLDEPVVIDNLLALTGNAAAPIVNDIEVEPGEYQWVRLYVDGGIPDSEVQPEVGNKLDLFIPGQQNGNGNGNPRFLQLNTGFTIAAGSEADFTIDFVLRKGLTKPANSDYYLLRPAMRLVDNVEVGTITGTVDSAIPDSLACVETDADYFGSVYLYEGDLTAEGSAEPDDVYDPGIESGSDDVQDAAGERPVTTANVVFDEDSATLRYEIGFVRANEEGYSLAYSCNAKGDDPATDDDIPYTEVKYTTVEAGGTATVDFSTVPEVPKEPEEGT
ncbi:DUF4382 domain-containing protein [Spongiibacter nanhainus]|uniref:DUF4382 domain-containing protein n=1 Tax=Spongiibacter nanhainus TaxID=2794344 RepID=A0A7T4R203_9GAMM|nr:DUF4382 domain-containing protein [Spongiibacter nanhainus]QQD18842.1 DUF4382 domain-containing protein [Spongiibacter nanhainus]